MPLCGRGWGERCAKANPHSNCVCSCGGLNHGIYRVFQETILNRTKQSTSARPSETASITPPETTDDYDGEIIPQEEEDWLDRVIHDRAAFAAGLIFLGLDEKTVNEGLSHFDSAARQAAAGSGVGRWFFSSEEERLAFKKFMYSHIAKFPLTQWLRVLDLRVEDATNLQLKIPLFKLHSPKVEGSKVLYTESESSASMTPWSITVLGTGLGKSFKFGVRYKNTFVSSNGDCKLIYVPVTMKVETVAIYLRGEFIERRLRTELFLKDPKRISKCIESMSEEECSRELNAAEEFDDEFDYSEDNSKDTHKVEWVGTWSDTTELKLGLDALKTKAECKTTVTREREIGLIFELPAGHRYGLKQCREVRGIAWAVDRPVSGDAPDEQLIDDILVEPSTDAGIVKPIDEPAEGLADKPAPPSRDERSPDNTPCMKESSPFKEFLASIGDKLERLLKKLKR